MLSTIHSNSVELHSRVESPVAMQDAARYVLRLRKATKAYFGKTVRCEAAWHLLLALYAVEGARKGSNIGSVARRADVPRSTALRWLARLEREGLVELTPDQSDKRAVRVQLTTSGVEAIQRSFLAARVTR